MVRCIAMLQLVALPRRIERRLKRRLPWAYIEIRCRLSRVSGSRSISEPPNETQPCKPSAP